jgi:hypothetical protein
VELLLLSDRRQQLSLKLEMLKTVSLIIQDFMVSYVLLLIAFTVSFNFLFKGRVEVDGAVNFTNPLFPLVKTAIMF